MSEINIDTRMVQIATEEFGITLSEIKHRHRNVIWGSSIDETLIGILGYAVVDPTVKPEGDVVEEVAPVLTNGRYAQQWSVRPYTDTERTNRLNVIRTETIGAIMDLEEQALARGVPYDFGGDIGMGHIQLRDKDRANHAGMAGMAQRSPGVNQPFRSLENRVMMLTSDQVIAVTDASYNGYVAVLGGVWALKDAVNSSTSESEFPVIPTTLKQFYENVLNWTWVE